MYVIMSCNRSPMKTLAAIDTAIAKNTYHGLALTSPIIFAIFKQYLGETKY